MTVKEIENGVVQLRPRYGHLSTLNPEFASFKDAVDKEFSALWELPMDEFVEAWKKAPPALLEDSPVVGKDIMVEHTKVLVRDGTLIEIRIYKSITPVDNAVLNFNTHGGGSSDSSSKPKYRALIPGFQDGRLELMTPRRVKIDGSPLTIRLLL